MLLRYIIIKYTSRNTGMVGKRCLSVFYSINADKRPLLLLLLGKKSVGNWEEINGLILKTITKEINAKVEQPRKKKPSGLTGISLLKPIA